MFKLCRHSMNISQKSCFRNKIKISTGQLSCLAFQPSRLRVSIPGGYPRRSIPLFQALRDGQFLHIAFARDVDKDSGTLKS